MGNKYLELVNKAESKKQANELTDAMGRARDANRSAHAAEDQGKKDLARRHFEEKEYHCILLLLLPGSTLECEGTLFRISHKGNVFDGGVHMIANRFKKNVEGHPKLTERQRQRLLERGENARQRWLKKEEAAARRIAEQKAAAARRAAGGKAPKASRSKKRAIKKKV